MNSLLLSESARRENGGRARFGGVRYQFEPGWSAASTTATDNTFHQLAPYIGRLKTSIARSLVFNHTRKGDLIADPFSGCGDVALEAAANGRRVKAGDWNPNAVPLTRANVFAPAN